MDSTVQVRKMFGLTQHELAKRSGVPRTTIAYVDTGRAKFTKTEWLAILRAFDTVISERSENIKQVAEFIANELLLIDLSVSAGVKEPPMPMTVDDETL